MHPACSGRRDLDRLGEDAASLATMPLRIDQIDVEGEHHPSLEAIADDVHGLLIGGKRAQREASDKHQFGYGRLRYVGSGVQEGVPDFLVDARWLFGKEINLTGVQALGLALGAYFHELGIAPKVVVGHDFRSYSLSIKQALTLGLMSAGCAVHDIGLALSPAARWGGSVPGCTA